MNTISPLKAFSEANPYQQDWLANAPDSDIAGPSPFAFAGAAVVVGAAAPQVMALYLTEAGDKTAVSVNDIHQGQIGDCFLLSAIGEIALYNPAAISKMIHVNANGSETVSLFTDTHGRVPGFGATSFLASSQTVTNVFPNNAVDNGATQDVVGNQKEIWPAVIEKAYAQANGGYGGIQNGGNPCIALQELTGVTATWQSPASLTLAALLKDIAAGDLIVMDTGNSSRLPFNLVGNHAYMFEGLQTVGGASCVKLGNPWGVDQPSLIPMSQLANAVVEVDIGHLR